MTAPRYPDAERALAGVLTQFVAQGHVGTETPANLAASLPFVRVGRRGGTDDQVTDRARVDVDVFAATRTEAVALAETIRQYLTAPAPFRQQDPFDNIACESGPQELPWGDTRSVRRIITTYRLSARRRAS